MKKMLHKNLAYNHFQLDQLISLQKAPTTSYRADEQNKNNVSHLSVSASNKYKPVFSLISSLSEFISNLK